ncbi:hypothetical protein HK105_200938 [Polyrhizophydium stewartii]|uniref:Uncharacterized protein n=1 Tax=Polyrhizophydium stewartii TaxID=2732419 RepID=A0ABR4NIC7_9FUNG|nr:hypothetical protein HK105_001247 [Polyrhizophydium stewartii]
MDELLSDHAFVEKNASALIQAMFGYRRDRYQDDGSDSDMEVGFSVVDREEKRSARLARQEDAEEERREAELEARKTAGRKKPRQS